MTDRKAMMMSIEQADEESRLASGLADKCRKEYVAKYSKLKKGRPLTVLRSTGRKAKNCYVKYVGMRNSGDYSLITNPDLFEDPEFYYQVWQKRSTDSYPQEVEVHLTEGDKILPPHPLD